MLRLAILLSATTAIAAPPKPVKLMQTKEVTYGDKGWVVHGFRFIAATPTLSAQLNHKLMDDTQGSGWLTRAVRSPSSGDINCEILFSTSVLVSWRCSGTALNEGGGGGYKFITDAQLVIGDDNQLSELQLATVLGPGVTLAKLAAVKGTKEDYDECTIPASVASWMAAPAGLVVYEQSDITRFCMLPWDALKLAKDNPVSRALAATTGDNPPSESMKTWAAEPRFVAEADDVVLDKATGLRWTGHDNGADLTYDAARKLAHDKGGDWRLPTEEQLETLVDPEYAHREKTDCTKGKSDLLITPAIHLSCGLVWTDSSPSDGTEVGVGFISGTPRISKETEKKNYRALLVVAPPKKKR